MERVRACKQLKINEKDKVRWALPRGVPIDIDILVAPCGGQPAPAMASAKVRSEASRPIGRNRADRQSQGLTGKAADEIRAAINFAVEIGLPPNRFVTIHWQKAGVSEPGRARSRYLKLVRDWIASQGGHTAFVWVREGGSAKGDHVHILIHVAPGLIPGFNRRNRGWLKACGAAWKRGVLRSEPIGRSYRHALADPDPHNPYRLHLTRVGNYILKGTEPQEAQARSIAQVVGGVIVGKRSGTSENIGRRARASFLVGWGA